MLVNLSQVLSIAEQESIAIPAFNVYNLETAMGVAHAAEALNSPVIFQVYSRLFTNNLAQYLAPSILKLIEDLPVPCAFHLDHGASMAEVQKALQSGASGIMIDASKWELDENIRLTKEAVTLCSSVGVPVEGELGHVGTTKDAVQAEYTKVDEAVRFIQETGVAALAVMIGTAHGRYLQAPKLDIKRLSEIADATRIPIVLHGGSGIPDDQIRQAIASGVRKVNFGTDVCYSFLNSVRSTSEDIVGVDLFMKEPTAAVEAFAREKITLLRTKL
ncbi:MAG: class II fructose-bisphosphate aldolase [Spirochaetia bacterium]|nr:class II fructose-bisphosphate aldolase [Spirochaetia bacterium]